MINILLIEDDMRDAGQIISLLNSSLAGKYDYSLLHKSGTNEALACIEESRIRQVLSPRNASEPDSVIFPASARDGVNEGVPIHKISYIVLTGRGRYDIHLTTGKVLSLRSVLFRDLLRALKEQNITSLRPLSRNEIININYISKITKSPNGRLSVTVIGHDEYPFHVGAGYEKFFLDEFF